MADIKTGIFAKNVQKRLNRAQEKVLQKLGKADETKDEQFEEYVQNFKRQEAEGTRLQRELRGYLAAIKGMQEASMKLTESLHEVYEPDWYGREDVKMVGEKCDVLWEDFHQKLVDGSLLTLDTYLGQFPDIKNRIAKRSRKLVDYDSARHHLEALQSSKRKDESRISKAEEEFQKAQKVFEEFNVDLQEELPSLWSRRVGFYVNTFKNVSSLEAKFHKEIAVLCHKLYEVMTKLGDQHADKAFSIQGAPSDSGPLRIAKTPSPPEEPSPLPSPTASPNHTLAPASPAPVRPRSPSQTRKGPPVPPLPKVTPTKELKQENIINFFEDNFVPEINVTTPSQNEVLEVKKEETLLDLDFDPFKPDVTPAGSATAAHSPMSQTLPWDLWTTTTDLVQPASGGSFNGFTQPQETSLFTMQADQNMVGSLAETEQALSMEPQAEEPPATTAAPAAGLDLGLEMEEPKEEAVIPPGTDADETVGTTVPTDGVPVEEAEAEKAALPAAEGESLDGTKVDAESNEVTSSESPPPAETEVAAPQEKVIPSVVIEPASNHEGEGEHHETTVGATEDVATQGQAGETQELVAEATPLDSQAAMAAPGGAGDSSVSAEDAAQDMPPGFLYKVETLHDFEAANSDELNLQRGDVVLVVPSDSEADQDAGWLVGVKESDWLQYRDLATYKGLFPENFTRRLE
ncbi:amphiphysin isoform X2 [Alexandromys fortis]|uniref:amphiphysin isoform X1 n=2 Tax=Alexandromys fortis TaxID=100897 RepID=UPI0021521E17|nr:amphiphysin isoform X1 [Microtus fortis]XP_049998200.1 amphiphysin isoform X2 [Microtus fortis]